MARPEAKSTRVKQTCFKDVQSSENLRGPATDCAVCLRPTHLRYCTCSEPDLTPASYCHPTGRPTDSPDIPARHGANPDLICVQSMKRTQTWPTCRAWSEPGSDLPVSNDGHRTTSSGDGSAGHNCHEQNLHLERG